MSESFFLEGSSKIWVDKRMRTEIEQVLPRRFLLHQLVILVDSVLMRGRVLFLGAAAFDSI